MSPTSVRRAAERTFDIYAVYGISVEGVLDTTVQDACRGERVVGDEDAEPRVARIVAIDPEGNLDLQVPPGSVESHRDLLARV